MIVEISVSFKIKLMAWGPKVSYRGIVVIEFSMFARSEITQFGWFLARIPIIFQSLPSAKVVGARPIRSIPTAKLWDLVETYSNVIQSYFSPFLDPSQLPFGILSTLRWKALVKVSTPGNGRKSKPSKSAEGKVSDEIISFENPGSRGTFSLKNE